MGPEPREFDVCDLMRTPAGYRLIRAFGMVRQDGGGR
jgi:hypothetical protein